MINNITTMDTRPQMAVAKPTASVQSMGMPPILGFKTPLLKQKADIRVKKIKRGDNIIIPGIIDSDYVDIVEETVRLQDDNDNFFTTLGANAPVIKHKPKYLKN